MVAARAHMPGSAIQFEKRELTDRIADNLDKFEPRLRAAFLQVVANIKSEHSLVELSGMLKGGRLAEALASVERHAALIGDMASQAFIAQARSSAMFLSPNVGPAVFDVTNTRAVQAMQRNQLRMIREFTAEQREATRAALLDGVERGLNPIQQARAFRDSIGLTARQQQAVNNYRRLLEQDPSQALSRRLRDRRFDRSIRRAAAGEKALTRPQIDRMVERYRQRYITYRSEVIARTEALRAVHQGAEELYQQAIDDGSLDPETLVRTWVSARDSRVRDSHATMNRQKRRVGESFISGNGRSLRYPGDPSAPISETAQCRCTLTTRIERLPSATGQESSAIEQARTAGAPQSVIDTLRRQEMALARRRVEARRRRAPSIEEIRERGGSIHATMRGRDLPPIDSILDPRGGPIRLEGTDARLDSLRDVFRRGQAEVDRVFGVAGQSRGISLLRRNDDLWDITDGRHRMLVSKEFPDIELPVTFGVSGS